MKKGVKTSEAKRAQLAGPYRLTREVDDFPPEARDLVERTIFLAVARDKCEIHARYSVDRLVMTGSDRIDVDLTRCCAPDDQLLRALIDFSTSLAAEHREEIPKMTKVRPGAAFDLETWVPVGFYRRRRGEALTLETTLEMTGEERLRDEQVARLRELVDEAATKGEVTCPTHGASAFKAVHVEQTEAATIVDLVVCCTDTNNAVMVVQLLVDDALLSGPVVPIVAGTYVKGPKKRPPKRTKR